LLRKNRRQTFLLPTNTCPRILLAASCHLHTSCHCEPCRIHGAAISLLVDRHTTFAMTTCFYTCQQLVIANPNKIFLRSLNVSLPLATLVAWWKQSACQLQVIYLLTDRHTAFAMTILHLVIARKLAAPLLSLRTLKE
jgi:hypothetical protein